MGLQQRKQMGPTMSSYLLLFLFLFGSTTVSAQDDEQPQLPQDPQPPQEPNNQPQEQVPDPNKHDPQPPQEPNNQPQEQVPDPDKQDSQPPQEPNNQPQEQVPEPNGEPGSSDMQFGLLISDLWNLPKGRNEEIKHEFEEIQKKAEADQLIDDPTTTMETTTIEPVPDTSASEEQTEETTPTEDVTGPGHTSMQTGTTTPSIASTEDSGNSTAKEPGKSDGEQHRRSKMIRYVAIGFLGGLSLIILILVIWNKCCGK